MSIALDYMDCTEILDAAVCDRKDCLRSLQEEFLAHVQDATWFEREHVVNEHRYAQHIPWDDDDEATAKYSGSLCILCVAIIKFGYIHDRQQRTHQKCVHWLNTR